MRLNISWTVDAVGWFPLTQRVHLPRSPLRECTCLALLSECICLALLSSQKLHLPCSSLLSESALVSLSSQRVHLPPSPLRECTYFTRLSSHWMDENSKRYPTAPSWSIQDINSRFNSYGSMPYIYDTDMAKGMYYARCWYISPSMSSNLSNIS